MKPCIVILSYPDTDNKIQILSDTINSVTGFTYNNCDVPVFVFSNLDIDKDQIPKVDKLIYSGKNKMFSALDFFAPDVVSTARELTKYRHNLVSDTDNISYVPLQYGTEKNYYWALTELYRLAFSWITESGFTHFMLLQELKLGESELQLVDLYFTDLIRNDLDGIVAFEPDQGPHHMSDFVFFGKSKWWSELFDDMTVENFYYLSFPNWTIEEYYHRKLIIKGGNIKYKVRNRLNEHQLDYWSDSPETWKKEILNIDCNTTCTWKLFFPDLIQDNFSNNHESDKFDVAKWVDVSIIPNGENHDIFIYNKSDLLIEFNILSSHPKVDNIHFYVQGKYYKVIPTENNLKGTELTFAYSYFDGGQKCQTKFYQL